MQAQLSPDCTEMVAGGRQISSVQACTSICTGKCRIEFEAALRQFDLEGHRALDICKASIDLAREEPSAIARETNVPCEYRSTGFAIPSAAVGVASTQYGE